MKNLDEKYIENLKNTGIHPCYSETAHFKVARIHLPVAPKCNIQCRYCKRDLNKIENRPGVAFGIQTPEEALHFLKKSMEKIPNLKIIGIAGPGEPLANPETFETFRLINVTYPELGKCIATNGLLLSKYVDELVNLDVINVTVTVNAIDPEVAAKIYPFIMYEGKRYENEEAGKIIVENQLKGIEMAVNKGLMIRINTVLIPSINFNQIEKIAKETAARGAVLHNIMPLIPIYEFKGERPPTREEMHEARIKSQNYLPQFKLCKQCRADAVGIPGFEKIGTCNSEDCSHIRFHG
ncbi:MAG: radical SAM protein [Candidatus Lokiarchaeota archaeon]|nr:radical SAM protein [Candidatus Lokiarchaeota archaeon]